MKVSSASNFLVEVVKNNTPTPMMSNTKPIPVTIVSRFTLVYLLRYQLRRSASRRVPPAGHPYQYDFALARPLRIRSIVGAIRAVGDAPAEAVQPVKRGLFDDGSVMPFMQFS